MEPSTAPIDFAEQINFAAQKERNKAALALLEEWRNDTSGYEEDNAAAIDRALSIAQTEPFRLREPSAK